MNNPLSLAFLTVADASAVEMIRAAAQAGFDAVGLRMLPAAAGEPDYPLLSDASYAKRVGAELRATGIRVADVEIVRLGVHTRIADFEPFLARAAELGASNVLVAGDDPDESRLTANFAGFCALASQYGLTGDLEFMPWTKVPDLQAARRVVEGAGAANGGILVDALHWHRAGVPAQAVAELPANLIHYAQICDAPHSYDPSDEALIRVARGERLFPGEGDLDLTALLRALPEDVVVSVEVPNRTHMAEMSVSARALLAAQSAKRSLQLAARSGP